MHGDGSRAGCRFQMGMRGRTAPLGTKPEMDPERGGQGAGETWASPGPNKSTARLRPRALSEVPAGGRELSAQ